MKKEIELNPKKPKLAYVGMDKKVVVESVPTQVVEVVYPSKVQKSDESTLFSKGQFKKEVIKKEELPKNRLIWTNDNLVALKTLLNEKDPVSGEYKYRNKIDLIYIDPPFMVQGDFIAQNSIDIGIDKEENIGSVKEPTIIETIAYKDTWQNGLDSFLQMMRDRLVLIKELLSNTGSIYVHLDWHTVHYVKVLMDEMFDYNFFRNEIIWKYRTGNIADKQFMRKHDVMLFYSKTEKNYFVPQELKEYYFCIYGPDKKISFKSANDGTDKYGDYRISQVDDVWTDIPHVFTLGSEWTPFPTQKPIKLLDRIIKSTCKNGSLILDAFMGSGTTCEAAERLAEDLNCYWIGIDNSKFAIHTARKRLIELDGKTKKDKGEGVYRVRPFTVENIGYYQRDLKWDSIQIGKNADAYRQAIIDLFGGEYLSYSKLLHGKKNGSWIHVGPLSFPIVKEQLYAIAEEVKETEFKRCYVLSADFTAHNQSDIEKIKKDLGIQIMVRLIPASAIEEVNKRLNIIKGETKNQKNISEMPNIAFFAPLIIKIDKAIEGKEVAVELSGLEIDTESFLESQKADQREKLEKWLNKEKSWKSFVDFWAIDWNYGRLKDNLDNSIFENEWQSFKKVKGRKIVEDITFKAFYNYKKSGEYTIAVKVTDVFGNDGIVTTKIIIK
jgi:adenine-specific DNA-methyltransferase